MNIFRAFVISFISSCLLLKLLVPFLRQKFLVTPNSRSSHLKPIPSGGGIVFVLVCSIFSLFFGYWRNLFCLPLAIVGFADDNFELPMSLRYLTQTFTVTLLIFNSFSLSKFVGELDATIAILFIIFLIIGSTAVINFTNFMDGIDGIICGCMIVIFAHYSYMYNPTFWPLVASLFAFLFWNWSPAKVFMGDVGSTFLGAILVGIILDSKSINDALSLLLIASPILGDACICVIRRKFYGYQIFKAHKKHLYQRLVMAGISHSKVSILYIISTLILSISYILGGINYLLIFTFAIFLFGILLDRKIAIPFIE